MIIAYDIRRGRLILITETEELDVCAAPRGSDAHAAGLAWLDDAANDNALAWGDEVVS